MEDFESELSDGNVSETLDATTASLNATFDQPHAIPLFTAVPLQQELALVAVIVLLGFMLNIAILCGYWHNKTCTSVYIRALAIYDMSVLAGLVLSRVLPTALPGNVTVFKLTQSISISLGAFYLVGPLFLALDRILVVVFPLSFHLHKKSMRVLKVCILTIIFTANLLAQIFLTGLEYDDTVAIVFHWLLFSVFLLQFVVCIVLYTTIIIQLVKSTRKIEAYRQIPKE